MITEMKSIIKEICVRFKSPVTLLAVVAQIAFIAGVFNDNIAEEIKIIGGAVVEILTLFGIVNNPANSSGF